MPNFIAIRSQNDVLLGDLYEIDILPPPSLRHTKAVILAKISLDVEDSIMHHDLAEMYGVDKSGEVVITLHQNNLLSCRDHEFEPVSVPIRVSRHDRLGNNFVLLGTKFLLHFFDIYRCSSRSDTVEMLLLEPLAHYRHWCREFDPEPLSS